MRRPAVLIIAIAVLALAACGCGEKRSTMLMATTTSVQDSGLLDVLVEEFERQYPYTVKAVAVGSGAALFMGRNGDASVMITHEPKAEGDFAAAGNAESMYKVMHNDFVIVGPKDDPAKVAEATDAVDAFRRIAASGEKFVTRGDGSGTNAKELEVWSRAGIVPGGEWYVDTGEAMAATVRIANDMDAYTITDRATFIVMDRWLDLELLLDDDPTLLNQYTVTVVNPEKFPGLAVEGARAFSEFMRKPSTKKLIREFGWDEYEKRLFYPD